MEVTFIGSGDAFGSGGRFNTCFLVAGASCRLLIDCGVTSLVALKQRGIAPNDLDGVVVSHLHGDHFGGLPFLLLDAHYMSDRRRPLFLWGPAGLAARLAVTREALFPGSTQTTLRFQLTYCELAAGERAQGESFAVTPFPAAHAAGAPCFSLRLEIDGRVIAFSGDTAWTDALTAAGRGADLFICECSGYAGRRSGHLDYEDLSPRLERIGAKRVILTHMNPDMLDARDRIAHETAADGLTIAL